MPRLTLIKNPLTPEDKVVFYSQELDLKTFLGKFLFVNPTCKGFLQSNELAVKLNDVLLTNKKSLANLVLKNDDEFVVFPNITTGVETAAVVATAAEVAATTGPVLAAPAIAAPSVAATGLISSNLALAGMSQTAIGALELGATMAGVSGSVSVGSVVAEMAISTALSMGVNAMFAPSLSSPSGPTDSSPSYGWDLSTSAKEGIAIPVVYGEHLIGGNVITSAKEYTIQEEWRWKEAKKDRKPTLTWNAFPFLNTCLLGATEPIRGVEVECKLDTPYIFFSYKLWDEKRWLKFWADLFDKITENDNTNPITTTSHLDSIVSTINAAVIYRLTQINEQESPKFTEILDNPKKVANLDLATTTVNHIMTSNALSKPASVNGKLYIVDFAEEVLRRIEVAIDDALDASWEDFKDTIIVTPFDPISQGSTYTEVFQKYAKDRDNLGTYVFGCWYINTRGFGFSLIPNYEKIAAAFLWFGDLLTNGTWAEGLYDWAKLVFRLLAFGNFDGGDHGLDTQDLINFETFALEFQFDVKEVLIPKYSTPREFIFNLKRDDDYEEDIKRSQVLHQLTALSEGECKGLKEVFVEDSPAKNVQNLEISFFKGDNAQNISVGNQMVNTFDNFNHATKFHSRDNELNDKVDYVEFLSTKNFSVDNVIVETQSTIYRVSKSGHTRPLQHNFFKFAIQVGFTWSDFDAWDGLEAITPAALQAGAFLHQEYELKGQFDTQPTISRFAALPIRDFLMPEADLPLLVTRFPFAALGLCAWLGITFGGEEYVHQRYISDTPYRDTVLNAIKEKITTYFLGQGERIRVRVIRLVPSWDNSGFSRQGAFDFKVTGFQEVAYRGFDYPNTALMGIKFKANSKYNASIPKITTLLKGKKVLVPKLELVEKGKERVYHELAWFDEDVNLYRSRQHNGNKCTYARDSENRIVFVEEWSDNPVWCLYDLIINKRYGLGNYTSQFNLPIDWYLDTAEYCDTYVPDGTDRKASSLSMSQLIDHDSDFFKHGDPYYDDNEEELYVRGTGLFGGAITDALNYPNSTKYDKTVAGEAIFGRTDVGGWTKAVVERIFRSVPNVVSTYADITFAKAYTSTTTRVGSEFWTNGIPCIDSSNTEYYNRYQLGEKRFVLDLVIDSTSSAIDWLKTICDTFRAFPMWVGGGYRPVIDRIKDPVAILGMGNIIKDSLEVSYVPLSKSYNIVEAQFMNELNMYKRDTRQVVDAAVDVASATAVHNTIRTKQVKLSGVTRPSQIVRELLYQKINSNENRKTINFGMGVEHVNMTAGDIFVFNHSLMTSTILSGRIQGYDSSSGDKVLLDQDLSGLSLPLNLNVTLLIGDAYCDECQKTVWKDEDETIKNETATTCPYCGGPIDGTEEVVEVSVTSIDGNWVYATFGQVKPVAFNVYEIGPSTETSQKYRVMSVQPDINNVAQVMAIEYNKATYGKSRTLVDGVTETAYDEATIATQNNQVSILPLMKAVQPVRSLLIIPYNLLNNEILIKFLAPSSIVSNILYKGGRVVITDPYGISEEFTDVDGDNGLKVGLADANAQYKIQVFATYAGKTEAVPVQTNIQLNIFNFGGQATEVYAPEVPNLRLASRSRPWGKYTKWEDNYNGFISSRPVFKWDAVGLGDEDNDLFTKNQLQIAGYRLTIELSHSPREDVLEESGTPAVWGKQEVFTTSKWVLEKAVDLASISNTREGDTPAQELAKIQGIRASIEAFTDGNQYSQVVKSEVFYPHQVACPLKVTTVPFLGSVYIWWNEDPDWQDIDHFEVYLKISKPPGNFFGIASKKSYEWETTEPEITTNRFITIKIPVEEVFGFNALGALWGCTFEPAIVAVTKTGALRSARGVAGPIEEEPPVTQTPQGGIPDYMLQTPASHITVYDTIRPFHLPPTVAQQRSDSFQFTESYNVRQALIDGHLGSGVEYTGLIWGLLKNVVRITYESPNEEDFIKIAFNVDKACKIWVEYLQQDDYGNYLRGRWDYLGGNDNGDHDLDSDGQLTSYATSVLAIDKYWEVPSGSSGALFPVALKNKYLRLMVSPLDESSTVTVNEIRFTRVGTFDQVSVDLIKNLNWDSGDEKFYLDANATGMVDPATGPSSPVLWASDGGIGTSREYPAVRLTTNGLYIDGPGGIVFSGENGLADWTPDNQYYLSNWNTDGIDFSSTGQDNVTWSSGDIILGDNITYSITGDSATISAGESLYVYFDRNSSTTTFSTTNTFSTLIEPGYILIARATYNSDALQSATITCKNILPSIITSTQIGPNSITTSNLTANCVDTDQLNAGAVEADKINVSTLAAISADCGTLSAGIIQNSGWGSGEYNFYLDADGTGLVSGEIGPSDPVFWASDGGIGGTREYPNVRLTPSGLLSGSGDGFRVENSGEIGPSGEGSWSLIDDYYMKTWTTTVEFSSTGYNNITWSSGTLTFADLTIHSISGGSATIPEDGTTFVYFEKSVSTTELQTTNDFSELVRYGLVIICRAIYNSNTASNASIIGQGIVQPRFTENEIAPLSIATIHYQPNSITSGEIAHNTIQTIHYEPNSIDYEAVGENAIDTIHIVENAITAVEVATNAIETVHIVENAITAVEVATNAIETIHITDNAITSGEVASNAINTVHIVENAITTVEVATNAIETINIVENAITPVEVATNAIETIHVSAGAITSGEIATDTIIASNIAAGVITANEIAANTITATNISGETITANEIATGTITTNEIATNTITADNVASNTITASEIKALTITSDEIAANTITASEIFSGTITANEIATGTITANEIATNTITATNISGESITANEIAAGTITGDKIHVNTIEAGNISGETITANEILSGTITTNQIATDTITANNISGGTITANEISSGTITSEEIATNTITAQQISGGTITANEISSGTITSEEIATNTITAQQISGETITANEIAVGTITGDRIHVNTIEASVISGETITANEIAVGTITGDRIHVNTIEASVISGETITANEIAVGTITGDRIAVNTIEAKYISGETITSNEIAAGTIKGDRIEFGTLSGEHIGANTIKGDNIFFGTISGEHIAANTITAQVISGETITSNEIASQSIRGDRIEFGTLSGEHIGANTIKGDNIFFGTISGEHIAANTITAQEIFAKTITANEIQNATITSGEILGGTITGALIEDGTITGALIGDATIVGGNIDTNTITATHLDITEGLSSITADVGTLTAGVFRNTDWGDEPTATNNKFQLDLSTGIITVNTEEGLIVSAANGMTVTGGINVTTGGVTIGAGGSLDVAGSSTISGSETVTGDITVTTGGITIEGSGELNVGGAATITGTLGVSGTTTLIGDLNVTTWLGDSGAININSADAELNVTAGAINITSSGAINIDTEEGLVVSAASGMTVTGGINVTSGDINIGASGDINIAEGGDILFTDTAKIDISSTSFRIMKQGTGVSVDIGTTSSRWGSFTACSNIAIIDSTGILSLLSSDTNLSGGIWMSLPTGLFGTTRVPKRLYISSGFVKAV